MAFAKDGKFDATAIALALMADLPVDLIERLMVQERSEQIVVIARAIGLTWNTTKAILAFQASAKGGVIHRSRRVPGDVRQADPGIGQESAEFLSDARAGDGATTGSVELFQLTPVPPIRRSDAGYHRAARTPIRSSRGSTSSRKNGSSSR